MNDIQINTTLGKIIISFKVKLEGVTKRDFEKKEVQRLIELLGINYENLSYGDKGNPILKNLNSYISISHSEGWFAVYLGSENVGVDIQAYRKRIAIGKSYFTNEHDSHWMNDEELHLVWATKEAIFKKYKGEMIDLAEEVSVTEIDTIKYTIKSNYKNKIENLKFEKLENAVLVYTIN